MGLYCDVCYAELKLNRTVVLCLHTVVVCVHGGGGVSENGLE